MCSKPIFCSKIALKGKTCSRLLKPQKVAPKAKSCSTVAEHNRDRPTYNPTSPKATMVRTLTRRAQIVCDSDDSFTDEIKHLNTVFAKNYNTDFMERNTYIRPNDSSHNSYTTTVPQPLYLTYEAPPKP